MRCILLVNTEVATAALTKFSTLRALGSTEASYAGLAVIVSENECCTALDKFCLPRFRLLSKHLRFALGRNEWVR